jgi:ribosome-associated toxin RatA of RatAB toxin-antitoxin module
MSDRTQGSIVIDAPAAEVMAAIADFPRYPEWVSAANEVTVLATGADGRAERVRFALDAGVLRDTYELQYSWEPGDRAVSWELISSTLQRAQHGRYDLRADGDRTTVTYTLEVTLQIPMLGMLRRKAEKTITDTALRELKRHVEGQRTAGPAE